MAKVFITAKGGAMKETTWVEGQEISCSEPLANLFIEKGIATAQPNEGKAAVNDKKTTKKKSE